MDALPEDVRWTMDGRWICFRRLPPHTDWRAPLSPYLLRLTLAATPGLASRTDLDTVGRRIQRGSDASDGRGMAVASEADLFLVDRRAVAPRRLTGAHAADTDP